MPTSISTLISVSTTANKPLPIVPPHFTTVLVARRARKASQHNATTTAKITIKITLLPNMSVSSRDGAVLYQHHITVEADTHRRGDEFSLGERGDYSGGADVTNRRAVYVKRPIGLQRYFDHLLTEQAPAFNNIHTCFCQSNSRPFDGRKMGHTVLNR